MRLSIPAAILAALTLWPSSAGIARAQALDLEVEVEEVAYCAAITIAHAFSRAVETQDLSLLNRAYLFANRAQFTKYIIQHGHFPAFEVRESMTEASADEMSSFIRDHYDESAQTWSRYGYKEIVACYEKLSTFVLLNGSGVIVGNDLRKLRRISTKQVNDLIEQARN